MRKQSLGLKMLSTDEELERRRKQTILKILRLPLAKRVQLVRLQAKRRGLYLPLPFGLPNSDEQDRDSFPILVAWLGKAPSNDGRFRTEPFFYPPAPPCTVIILDGEPPPPYG